MEQKDLEKIVKIILDNPDKEEATRLIVELIKSVEKPPEIRIVHDYTPYPNYINDPNKLTWPGWEPFRYEPTCQSDTAKNTHWEQPCSTTTAMNDSNLSYSATSSMKEYTQQQKKGKSLGEIFDAMDDAEKATNKRGFA